MTDSELHARYQAVLPEWVAPLYAEPISIAGGRGSCVETNGGDRYLDFFGGVLTTVIGHGNPEVVAAVQAQAAKTFHTSTLYLCEPMIELAEEIAGLSGIPDARVFFTTSGTEANDTALLLASNHRRSNQILALRNSYHGRSFSTMGVTGQRHWSASGFSGLNVSFVQGGYRLRSPFSDLDDGAFTAACTEDLVQILDMTTSGTVAAMIAEPIQGVGGCTVPPDGFFRSMKKVLDRDGILFISDEVQTGWGRTGEHFWGYQAHGIVPDILTFAKGVGNGMPLAGVVARAEVMNSLDATSFSTFGGDPIVAAAGLATLGYIRRHDTQTNALRMGARLTERLAPVVGTTDWIAELRGRGLMQALEVVHPGGIEPDPGRTLMLLEACKSHGLLVGKGGLYGNVIRVAPMLDVTEAELDEGIAALVAAIADCD